MTQLTAETDVFSFAGESGRCAVAFLARPAREPGLDCSADVARIEAVADAFGRQGWHLSVSAMFGEAGPAVAAFDVGFAHNAAIAGAFEAPSISAALDGTVRLEKAGWAKLFDTTWLIGPREFEPVPAPGETVARPWGFLALWEWNDAWCAASGEERTAYDAECDVAFANDLALGVNIAGRHRIDWASSWHHLGMWQSSDLETVDRAMQGHEDAADFMFTTSRHFVGLERPLGQLLRQHAGLSDG